MSFPWDATRPVTKEPVFVARKAGLRVIAGGVHSRRERDGLLPWTIEAGAVRDPDIEVENGVVRVFRPTGHEVEAEPILGERWLLLGVARIDPEAHRLQPCAKTGFASQRHPDCRLRHVPAVLPTDAGDERQLRQSQNCRGTSIVFAHRGLHGLPSSCPAYAAISNYSM